MSDKKKKKKQKVTYIDDGRTIADMSGTSKPGVMFGNRPSERNKKRGTAKQQFNTYVSAMRQMVLPMFIVMGIITVAFLVMYLLLKYGV